MIRARQGFTAIELVSAVTVLMLIAVMLGLIFTKGDRIWTRGTDAARHRGAGRAVLEFITQDLEHAVADSRFPFVLTLDAGTNTVAGPSPSDLRFVTRAALGSDGTNRAVTAVAYRVEATEPTGTAAAGLALVRIARAVSNHLDEAAADNLYWQTNWVEHPLTGSTGVLAQSVTAFRLGVPDQYAGVWGEYDSRDFTNRLPFALDVFLELLPREAATRLAQLPPERQSRFLEQNAVRYTTRVHFRNRWGNSYRGR
jgi:hypothetical protein